SAPVAGYSACLTSFTSSIRFSLHAYDEAAAIMATNDTRIFFMVGSPVFTYPNNQWLITEKAVDLRAG
ncbi:hypothetical protein ACQ93S_24360, partial [Escherichia coli]